MMQIYLQYAPVYPKLHVHMGEVPVVRQNPPFLQGSIAQNGTSHKAP